jgi:parallel beta-helix repeat protein
MFLRSVHAFILCLAAGKALAAFPELLVTRDDTVITQSCRVVIPPGTVIADPNTNGVLHIQASGITVEFAPGSRLRGAPPDTDGDVLRGIGIRIDTHAHVTLLNAHVHGFFNGVIASAANDLVIEGGDFSGNYRQRLRSTPQTEDASDWLFPHHNDQTPWRNQYGGAVCIERSSRVTIRGIRIRRGQNGILLDRVTDSKIFDNDASFLSGWGIALWRSSHNVISRNAFDFCVRGYSEGVYNRGQDSAGILCFEQSNSNTFADNSATHGGDGFFGFAGRDALGETWLEQERLRLRTESGRDDVEALIQIPADLARDFSQRGCNSNILVGNDFSFSPAHGIEMTFSEGNVFARNRLIGNAICGIWGGYSSGSLIVENEFDSNGALGYGLERGAINMEHASSNRIARNTFRNNRAGIHLWWDQDPALLRLPGVSGGSSDVSGNIIDRNLFILDSDHPFGPLQPSDRLPVLQLRDDGDGHVRDNLYLNNTVRLGIPNAVEFLVKPGTEPRIDGTAPPWRIPRYTLHGTSQPVGARKHLHGRHHILLDEWGPWDHEGPFVRPITTTNGAPAWEVFNSPDLTASLDAPGDSLQREARPDSHSEIIRIQPSPGVTTYQLHLKASNLDRTFRGQLLQSVWDATFFSWRSGPDPRTNLVAWRALALDSSAVHARVHSLHFNYGGRGPRNLDISDRVTKQGPDGERFGMIARTSLPLPAGSWRWITRSDDGVRVTVDDKVLIENWTWHGPERNEAILKLDQPATLRIEVEHFEIDGHSELSLDIEPVADR